MEPGELTAQGLLCDYAQVSGGKLFISGAGINLVATATTEAPHPVNMAVALMVRIPWNATNQQHRLTIELMSESGPESAEQVPLSQGLPPGADPSLEGMIVANFNAGRAPTMVAGEESLMPVALPMLGLPLPRLGSFFFSVSINGTEVERISFRVASALNFPGQASIIQAP
jgi:hypothetical protein